MSTSDTAGFGKFVPGFDFLQNLAKAAGGAGSTAVTSPNKNASKQAATAISAPTLAGRPTTTAATAVGGRRDTAATGSDKKPGDKKTPATATATTTVTVAATALSSPPSTPPPVAASVTPAPSPLPGASSMTVP